MNKTIFLLIAGIIFLVYANTLRNDFIGDDTFLFVDNNFYHDPKNLSKIFSKDFVIKSSSISPALNGTERSSSGCVSYRPVSALSFFADYSLWKLRPFGYHMSNIILHSGVAVLVFLLSLALLKNQRMALMAALLFAVHPIHSEAVSNIGYRSDLLALLFYLASLVLFIRQKTFYAFKKGMLMACSYGVFFLALFSKESAVSLPFVILIYDLCLAAKENFKSIFSREKFHYLGFFVILIFYLYIYLAVFPNATTYFMWSLLGSWNVNNTAAWLVVTLKIFYEYILVLFLPFKVTILPTLYSPSVSSIKAYELIVVCCFLVLSGALALKAFKKSKEITFLVLWFFISYLPTSNILPSPNPIAFRFMYLPAVSFCLLASIFLEKAFQYVYQKLQSRPIGFLLRAFVLSLCAIWTIGNSTFFKNDITASLAMIKDHPEASKPYLILGQACFANQHYDEAAKNLSQYLQMDKNNFFVTRMRLDSFVYDRLGMCYVHDTDRALMAFQESIRLKPQYSLPYIHIAEVYIFKKDFKAALAYTLKAIELNQEMPIAYVYAIQCYLQLKEKRQGGDLLGKALSIFPQDEGLRYLQKLIEENKDAP